MQMQGHIVDGETAAVDALSHAIALLQKVVEAGVASVKFCMFKTGKLPAAHLRDVFFAC